MNRRFSLEVEACGFVEAKYETIEDVGQGTYGIVRKAKNRQTSETVAIKYFKYSEIEKRDGTQSSELREISILKELSQNAESRNIVKFRDICRHKSKNNFVLVMEYVPMNLKQHTNRLKELGIKLRPEEVRNIMYQLLTGIKAIHANRFIHRDIKPANILYDYTCQVLKIADFGLARGPNTQVDFKEDLSNEIETFMYRPPEIILGARQYDEKVDMWAAGVIFYELLTSRLPFAGKSEYEVLIDIFKTYGTPTEYDWPGLSELQHFSPKFPRLRRGKKFDDFLHTLEPSAADLLLGLLHVVPGKRVTASAALASQYIKGLHKPPADKVSKGFFTNLKNLFKG